MSSPQSGGGKVKLEAAGGNTATEGDVQVLMWTGQMGLKNVNIPM
jgi:hypothetical protein